MINSLRQTRHNNKFSRSAYNILERHLTIQGYKNDKSKEKKTLKQIFKGTEMGSAPVTSICINPRGAVLRILQQTGGISESQLLRLLARYDAHMYIWRCLHTLCGCNFISKFLGGLLNEKYRTELCRFSGAKIYPGKGIRFIRSDSQVFLFSNSKCKRYFHNRLKPSKLTWTAMYRKQHKKDAAQEAVKKRRRTTKKPYSRSIVGATLEVIQKRRTEKPEVRDAAREAALREIKERIKKTKDEKKAKKAEVTAKTQKSQGKGISKGAVPKGPKLGGGGGKR
ncbi:unnamed protein product [Camellia sinensis]